MTIMTQGDCAIVKALGHAGRTATAPDAALGGQGRLPGGRHISVRCSRAGRVFVTWLREGRGFQARNLHSRISKAGRSWA